ncbi:MAG TPA: discoidin domain-containing protein [Gaiellaceae bacterium]|nr:discoidin domain-containing protein [Gaiellaceae bacterium]
MRIAASTAFGLSTVVAFCVVLAGCGGAGGATTATGVRDFSAIEVGKTRVQVAADGKSAVVRVQTDPPTVCAIAYGRTVSLGSIANDPSMGGSAISRHVVVLGGLRPNTTYRYRLTATDAQGRVFQTPELASFTTKPSRRVAQGRDVALHAKVVAVSSQYSGDYRAVNAFDGDLSTEWSSAGDGDRAFVTIDLGKREQISGVSFRTREMSDGSAITRTFAVVVDGGRRYGPFPAGDRVDPRTAAVSFTARRLRFEVVRSTGGNTGAAEIQVFSRG